MMLADMATRAAMKTAQDYHDATLVHPVALVATALLGIWLFFASRKSALAPLLILICFVPSAQRIVVAGADFTLLRIMVLFGIARIFTRGELSSIRFNRVDWVYLAWVLIGSLVYVLQRQEIGAVTYVCGTSMDMLGAYFVGRALIKTIDELFSFATTIALIAFPVAAFFVIELLTQRNLFGYLGGVSVVTGVREGRLRCQGAFAHPILAGVFWAAIGSLLAGGFAAARLEKRRRLVFGVGVIACVAIIGASASSTPVLGLIAGMMFWCFWPVKRLFRYCIYASPLVLLGLHIVMEAPVWHLVGRASAVGGSTGYHRYVLIDGAIKHFHEWWLLGSVSTVHWSEHFQTFDLTNQYILEGIRGGIWRLGLFCALIYLVCESIAKSIQRTDERANQLLLWGLGASMFVHCICFIGVSYFGQIQYLWYLTLAIGGSAYAPEFWPCKNHLADESQSQLFYSSDCDVRSDCTVTDS